MTETATSMKTPFKYRCNSFILFFNLLGSEKLTFLPDCKCRSEGLRCRAERRSRRKRTKTAFLSVYSSRLSGRQAQRNKGARCALILGLVRSMGLEPIRSPIRPSNVRVCLFRHDRSTTGTPIILTYPFAFCNNFPLLFCPVGELPFKIKFNDRPR